MLYNLKSIIYLIEIHSKQTVVDKNVQNYVCITYRAEKKGEWLNSRMKY